MPPGRGKGTAFVRRFLYVSGSAPLVAELNSGGTGGCEWAFQGMVPAVPTGGDEVQALGWQCLHILMPLGALGRRGAGSLGIAPLGAEGGAAVGVGFEGSFSQAEEGSKVLAQ